MRALSPRNRILGGLIGLAALASLYMQRMNPLKGMNGSKSSSLKQQKQQRAITTGVTLAPGELPGYTGWARPEFTLAGYFTVVPGSVETTNIATAGTDWVVSLQCTGHSDCATLSSSDQAPWFYVRAYGPSVITGRVVPVVTDASSLKSGSSYQVILRPLDPGVYFVEVVLAFSKAPAIEAFPLSPAEHAPVYYEGYLLPDFPMSLTVTAGKEDHHQLAVVGSSLKDELPFCNVHQLTEQSHNSQSQSSLPLVQHRARWRVVDKNHHAAHHVLTTQTSTNNNKSTAAASDITLKNYQESHNSLGVTMDYAYTDCQLIPPFTNAAAASSKNNPFECLDDKLQQQPTTTAEAATSTILHVILIGDSVMRLQKEAFERLVVKAGRNSDSIKITFIELFGGMLKCTRQTGPNVAEILAQLPNADATVLSSSKERRFVLFNTGMHDIHRLCGSEWQDDRKSYLTLQEQSQGCTVLYKQAVQVLADAVDKFPAETKIFQTTTAAWPKYGNYGVSWDPAYGQGLPLDPSFVEHFNRIAVDTLQTSYKNVQIIDGYYITLARPDNRETDRKVSTGKKLSHPGLQVIEAMVRIWTMLLVWTVCGQ